MPDKNQNRKSFHAEFLGCLIALVLINFSLASLAADSAIYSNPPSSFSVTDEQGLISVKAVDAPLKLVIEEIGQRLGIEVDGKISDDERVTADFEKLPLEQAIKQLTARYAYFHEKADGRITRIVLFPEGQEAPVSRIGSVPKEIRDGPEPFKFEFDPSQHMKK